MSKGTKKEDTAVEQNRRGREDRDKRGKREGGEGSRKGMICICLELRKATCTSQPDEEKLRQLPEIAAGKRSS